jgi:intein/homing endonuclease
MSKLSPNLEFILNKDQLQKDYQELKTLNKIAKKYSITTSTISKRFTKLGLVFDKMPHLYENNHNLFSEDSEKVFYLAGFIAADGCIRIAKTNKDRNHINYRIVIALSEKDLEFLKTLRNTIGCENPIGFYESKLSQRNKKWNDSKIVKLSITSKQMVEDLRRFNVVPNKSLTYDLPEWIIDHPLLNHFIRGYVDGDGSFWISSDVDKNNLTFSLRGTVPFLEKIKMILEKNCNLETEAKPKMSVGIGQFSVHSNKMVSRIVNYLYRDATIFLPRKHMMAIKAGKIVKIQEEAKEKIQDILGRE